MSRNRLLELLGLHGDATTAEIKARYRELARQFHPDLNSRTTRASNTFRAIKAAYQQLVAEQNERGADADVVLLTYRKRTAAPATAETSPRAPTSLSERLTPDRIARLRTELSAKLEKCKSALRRHQADVRDGEAKAAVARARGDRLKERHFLRRVEADRSRVYALMGELLALERELRGLDFKPK